MNSAGLATRVEVAAVQRFAESLNLAVQDVLSPWLQMKSVMSSNRSVFNAINSLDITPLSTKEGFVALATMVGKSIAPLAVIRFSPILARAVAGALGIAATSSAVTLMTFGFVALECYWIWWSNRAFFATFLSDFSSWFNAQTSSL